METRICGRCRQVKNKELDFYRNQGNVCKECRKTYPSQTPEKTLEKSYRIRERNRRFICEYYRQHPCVDCGETDPVVLELDHCRGEAKIAGVSQLVHNTRSLDVIRREIAKCDVVCANCHRRRTAKTQGWVVY